MVCLGTFNLFAACFRWSASDIVSQHVNAHSQLQVLFFSIFYRNNIVKNQQHRSECSTGRYTYTKTRYLKVLITPEILRFTGITTPRIILLTRTDKWQFTITWFREDAA